MKRLGATILIALITCASALGFFYFSGHDTTATLLGKPALKTAAPLTLFSQKAIREIKISQNGQPPHTYTLEGSAWMHDSTRADYRKLKKLLFALETATVLSPLPQDFTAHTPPVSITLSEEQQDSTPLLHTIHLHGPLPRYAGLDPLTPTFALTGPDGRLYACTSKLTEALPALTFTSLQDKRPFLFHPHLLSEIQFQKNGQLITIERAAQKSDWRITSPISLDVNQKEVAKLISHLYSLEAERLTLSPASHLPGQELTLSLKSFNSIIPTQSLTITSSTEASLPLTKSHTAHYTFTADSLDAALPDIDTLRSKKLLKLDLTEVDTLLLQSKQQSYPVSLKIQQLGNGQPRWMYNTGSTWQPADELAVSQLLTALTKDPVTGFTLETPHSSTEPDKSITIHYKNNRKETLHFYRLTDKIIARSPALTESFHLSLPHYTSLLTAPQDWKEKKLWDFSPIHLKGLQRRIKNKPIEIYGYNYNLDQWKGQIGEIPVNNQFDPISATSFLEFLETLNVLKWLSPHDSLLTQLSSIPALTMTVLSQEMSDMGDSLGLKQAEITLYTIKSVEGLVALRLKQDHAPAQFALIEIQMARRFTSPLVYQD